ncbi:unnamed protein product, partial [Vitis vinifera]|uniref:Uncharacterized protein n=1 Tax=Vitis vinifera TaxID=29760 RepID=D7U0K9_VITVI
MCMANGKCLYTGDVNEMKIAKPLERSYEENSLTPLVTLIFFFVYYHALCYKMSWNFYLSQQFPPFLISVNLYLQTISMDKDKFVKPLSSVLEAKRGNFSSQLGGVLPANRSSLTPYEQNQSLTLSSPSDLFSKKKSLLIPGRKIMQCSNSEMPYSFNSSLLGEKPSKEEVLVTCTAKKRRIAKLDPDAMQNFEMSHHHPFMVKNAQSNDHLANHSVKHDNSQLPDGTNRETQVGSAMLLEDDSPKKDAEFLSQKGKGVQSSPLPCSVKETRGSAFLIQVQEKLSTAEYKEFVGFMKALKSKAMKIGQVLESIARLFSGPERLPLLKRYEVLSIIV